jgi:hypothetical protein
MHRVNDVLCDVDLPDETPEAEFSQVVSEFKPHSHSGTKPLTLPKITAVPVIQGAGLGVRVVSAG